MVRLAVLASSIALVSACRISLEDGGSELPDSGSNVSPSCMEAVDHSDLAFIETKIFAASCVFSGCHNGANDDAGMMDLRAGMAAASLVNKPSKIDTTFDLVEPSMPAKSYLLMMVKHIAPADMDPPASPPPTDVGFMPQNAGGATICVQKREAIERWIMAGAQP